jgi:acetyl esterase/lipase
MKLPHSLSVILLSTVLAFTASAAAAPEAPKVISLWPGDAPGSEGKKGDEKVRITETGEHVVSGIHHPSLTIYLPAADKATGAAFVICPGGGHRELWMDHEGYNIARWLADHGIAAIILKYRLAHEEGSTYKVEAESLADAQRALRMTRSHAAEWSIDPKRIGIIGFSAGGELAALASQRFDDGHASAADPIEHEGCRPAFQALIYPGNSKSIIPAKDAPPAFLACGYDDRADIAEGIAEIYLRFKRAGVPAELHIYSGTPHGFGLRESNLKPSGQWIARMREWMGERGFLGKKP